jgi:hypothetical protein
MDSEKSETAAAFLANFGQRNVGRAILNQAFKEGAPTELVVIENSTGVPDGIAALTPGKAANAILVRVLESISPVALDERASALGLRLAKAVADSGRRVLHEREPRWTRMPAGAFMNYFERRYPKRIFVEVFRDQVGSEIPIVFEVDSRPIGYAAMHMKPPKRVYVDMLNTFFPHSPGKFGTKIMTEVCQQADAFGVELELEPVPQSPSITEATLRLSIPGTDS